MKEILFRQDLQDYTDFSQFPEETEKEQSAFGGREVFILP